MTERCGERPAAARGDEAMVEPQHDMSALQRRFMVGMMIGLVVLFALQALPYLVLPAGF